MVIAAVGLFVALGGGAYAAGRFVVDGHSIKNRSITASKLASGSVTTRALHNGAVTTRKLGRASVGPANLNGALRHQLATHAGVGPQGPAGPKGDSGPQGPAGPKGDTGAAGTNGVNGANPGLPVVDVPAIAPGNANNGNADSGPTGDQGFYFTGNGSGGSAQLTNGELDLQGVGIDSNTEQGAIGIAHAYNNVPLASLNALSYDWHVNQVKGSQAPNVHITVTGATADSKFSSGFTNLDYSPALTNGNATPTPGEAFRSDTFAPGAKWYSTAEPTISAPGGQNNPQPLSYFVGNDPNAAISQISLDNGGSSGASGSFDAGADDLIIGFTGSPFARYDLGG